jgi:hypothetical protein
MAQQVETALTKHKRPHLAKLLEAAKTCKHGPLKRYLEDLMLLMLLGTLPMAVIAAVSSGQLR